MKIGWLTRIGIVCSGLLLVCVPTMAEDGSGDMEGSVDLLYRNVSQEGSLGKYNEDFDGLSSGLRVGTVRLSWSDMNSSLADYARIYMTGLGGDPYEGASLQIGTQDVYDLKFNYRKQSYLYDLFSVTDDEDGHRWDTERGQTDLSLKVHVTKNVDVVAGFTEVTRRGDTLVMKDIERELFRLDTPLDQVSKKYSVGTDLRIGTVDVSFRQALLNNDFRFTSMTESDLGLDPANLSSITSYDWMQKDRTNSDLTTVKVHTPLGSRVDFTVTAVGSYLGNQELKSRTELNASGTSFTGFCGVALDPNNNPLSCSSDAVCDAVVPGDTCVANSFAVAGGFARSDVDMDTSNIDVDVAVKIIEQLNFIAQYRTVTRDASGTATLNLDGDPNSRLPVDTTINYDTHSYGGILEYQPTKTLRFRGGFRSTDRKMERSGFDQGTLMLRNADFESKGDTTVIVGAAWRPNGYMRFNADYEDGDRDVPFTAISLVETQRLRLRATLNPKPEMAIGLSYTDFQNDNPLYDSDSNGKSWAASFTHRANTRLDYSLSYSQQKVDSATPIVFDVSSFNFAFPGTTEAGDSLFDSTHKEGSLLINWAVTDAWKTFLRYARAEVDGNNVFFGDVMGVINDEVLDQVYSDVEVGVTRSFPGGLFVGGSFRSFDYDDGNDLLDYNGEILLLHAGLTF